MFNVSYFGDIMTYFLSCQKRVIFYVSANISKLTFSFASQFSFLTPSKHRGASTRNCIFHRLENKLNSETPFPFSYPITREISFPKLRDRIFFETMNNVNSLFVPNRADKTKTNKKEVGCTFLTSVHNTSIKFNVSIYIFFDCHNFSLPHLYFHHEHIYQRCHQRESNGSNGTKTALGNWFLISALMLLPRLAISIWALVQQQREQHRKKQNDKDLYWLATSRTANYWKLY